MHCFHHSQTHYHFTCHNQNKADTTKSQNKLECEAVMYIAFKTALN